MPQTKYVHIIPAPSSGLPAFDATVTEADPPQIWGPTDPRPTPPIFWPGFPRPEPPQPPEMGEPTSQWRFSAGGWYFVSGPYDKPKQICASGNARLADPIKSKWTTAGAGWYFVAGPFDKPIPVCGVEPPDPEPPTAPPAEGDWEYRDDGWYFTYGPLDKPKPMPEPPEKPTEPPPAA